MAISLNGTIISTSVITFGTTRSQSGIIPKDKIAETFVIVTEIIMINLALESGHL